MTLGACSLDVDSAIKARSDSTQTRDAAMTLPDAAVRKDAGAADSEAPDAAQSDAGTVDEQTMPDAAVQDAGAADAGMTSVKHPACTLLSPTNLPAVSPVATDATGRPEFDFFRDLSCAALEYRTCDHRLEVDARLCYTCLRGADADRGLCLPIASSCTLGSQWLTTRDGACRSCAPIEGKAKACCEHLPGFDCRAWPYPANSKVRELCARHGDCEPGLVCKQTEPGLNLCLCPETDPVAEAFSSEDDAQCRTEFAP